MYGGGTCIRLIDLETGEIRQNLKPKRFSVFALVAFSPNSQLLAYAGKGEIIIWNLHSRASSGI
jgi:WD40 repeat protein